jgi:NAD/NADP transhydrogenase alpha subunit
MKKTLAILALALFIGGISVPVIAVNHSNSTLISQRDEDPKKKEKSEKTEKSAEQTKEATKSGDCSSEKKAETSSEKKSDCSK